MKSLKCLLVLLTMLYLPLVFAASPVGLWTTIDDKTGEKRALVELVETNGVLNGKILKVYSQPGDTGMCKKCPPPFTNKPVAGLTFMWGLKEGGDDVWDGGLILDAKSGKIYRVKVTVKNNKLYVRGYIGVSLLGRTQVWVR